MCGPSRTRDSGLQGDAPSVGGRRPVMRPGGLHQGMQAGKLSRAWDDLQVSPKAGRHRPKRMFE